MSYGMLVGTALPPECRRQNCIVAYADNIGDLAVDVGHNGEVRQFDAVASALASTLPRLLNFRRMREQRLMWGKKEYTR